MIPKISPCKVFSTLGNNSSLVPMAMKDVINSCGLTAASYLSGDNTEGKDRLIDEFGTQAIWLWGIPMYKKALDFLMSKFSGLDPNIDVRISKNPEILNLAKKFAPNANIQKNIDNFSKHQKLAKGLTIGKFALSTALTTATYFGLTKFRHKYTENQIKKDYFEKQQTKKDDNKVSFGGKIEEFMFNPVKNLMLVDASITGERLTHSRNWQDFFGYVIKEGSFWTFMYLAGPVISKAMEKHAETKFNKSIDLDARVIESKELLDNIKNGVLKKHLKEFNLANKTDANLYKYAVTPNNKNLVVEMAKKSDIIQLMPKSNLVDTRKYIDMDELKGIGTKLSKLLNQYESSGQSAEEFLKSVRKLKRGAILKNLGACIGVLGILSPAIMLITRKLNPEYQLKKDIEAKLEKQNSKLDVKAA